MVSMQMLMTVCQVAVDGEASRLKLLMVSMIVLALAVIVNALHCRLLHRRIGALARIIAALAIVVGEQRDAAAARERDKHKLRPLKAREYRAADRSKSPANPQSSSHSEETATDAVRDPR